MADQQPPHLLIISCSLKPESRSRVLAEEAQRQLLRLQANAALLDLRSIALPQCDGDACYNHPAVAPLTERIKQAAAILLATPVYNYDASAATKNLIELTGDGWADKVVGFLCAAGGQRSYMAVMGLANSLMLDFRCLIVPRFVYCTGDAIKDGQLVDAEIARRIGELAESMLRLSALRLAK
jgi:FMN reductase